MTLVSCFSPSEEIMKSFKVIVKSIDKSNQYQNSKLGNLYNTISTNRIQNIDLAEKADTIYFRTKRIIEEVEIIRTELTSKDTLGDNINNSEKLLVNTRKGRELYRQFKIFYKNAKENLTDENLIRIIDSLSIDYPENFSEEKWLENNFKNIPTIGATTLLNKYQNDCLTTGEILLSEIKNKIKK